MDRMERILTNHAWTRERKFKWILIAKMLKKDYHELKDLNDRRIADIVASASSLDRKWRKITQENEELRGKDYDQKEVLVREKQAELGYAVTQSKTMNLL